MESSSSVVSSENWKDGKAAGNELSPSFPGDATKTKDQIFDVLRGLRPELETRYNVKAIGLFGSALRGEQEPQSDIDVLVEFRSPIGLFKFLEWGYPLDSSRPKI